MIKPFLSESPLLPPELIPIEIALSGVPEVSRSYLVLRDRLTLAAMPYPTSDRVWEALSVAGFSNVICLTEKHPIYSPAPLLVDVFPLEDLIGGRTPSDPNQELTMVRQAVSRVLDLLTEGRHVVVHCVGGRGRTGTVVGAALVALGHQPRTVTRWLDDVHQERGRDGWPESDWQEDVLERFRDGPV